MPLTYKNHKISHANHNSQQKVHKNQAHKRFFFAVYEKYLKIHMINAATVNIRYCEYQTWNIRI